MATLSLMPWIISREWTNDGKLASGAKIYTYDSGTNTPRATYKNSDGSVLNTNPVICDASGAFTIFLGAGAYRIKVCDSNDVQIMPPIDGVLGAGSGGISSDSTSNTTLLQTYAELRALLTTPDLVYVAGRTTEGDGGQGWFQYIPTSTDLDDDAIILTSQSGSKVYKRIFDGVIDPRWAGLVYSVAIDQTINFNKNTALSVKYGLPVLIAGNTYLNQNVTIPDNATIQMADIGYFTSTLSITMTFVSGSVFLGSDRVFGQSVQPKFEYTSVESIKLSWMAGNTDDEKVIKWVNASSVKIPRILDINVTIASSISTSADILATTSGLITYTSATTNATISATILNGYEYLSPIFSLHPSATFSTINLNTTVTPEWFGSKGDGSDETSILKFVFKNSKIYLTKSYKINQNISFSDLEIVGPGILDIGTYTLSGTSFSIVDASVLCVSGRSNEGQWRNITGSTTSGQLTFTSGFSNNIVVGSKFILSAQNDTWTSVSASSGNTIYTGKDWTLLGTNYYAGKKIQCVSNNMINPWITVNTFVGINATIDSAISASIKDITGCLFTDLSSVPAFEEPSLRKAKLPLVVNAVSLATDRNGLIFDIGKTITFTSGVDYTMTSNGSGWSTGIGFTRIKITPFTTHTALLNVVLQFNAGGVPPVTSSPTYADIDIVAINSTLQYWINNLGSGHMGVVDYMERYDNYSNYPCNIPASVFRAGYKTWVFCGPTGINGALASSLNTPNPWMGWKDIYPNVSYANPTQIKHGIGFSQIITIPNTQ